MLFNLSAGSLPHILEVGNLALADIRQRLSEVLGIRRSAQPDREAESLVDRSLVRDG